jgi:hypothetical protein
MNKNSPEQVAVVSPMPSRNVHGPLRGECTTGTGCSLAAEKGRP